MTVHKFKCNAPWTIDVNTVTPWRKTLEAMKIIALNFKSFSRYRPVKSIEADKNPLVQFGVNSGLSGSP